MQICDINKWTNIERVLLIMCVCLLRVYECMFYFLCGCTAYFTKMQSILFTEILCFSMQTSSAVEPFNDTKSALTIASPSFTLLPISFFLFRFYFWTRLAMVPVQSTFSRYTRGWLACWLVWVICKNVTLPIRQGVFLFMYCVSD